jgi:hypothetical protein
LRSLRVASDKMRKPLRACLLWVIICLLAMYHMMVRLWGFQSQQDNWMLCAIGHGCVAVGGSRGSSADWIPNGTFRTNIEAIGGVTSASCQRSRMLTSSFQESCGVPGCSHFDVVGASELFENMSHHGGRSASADLADLEKTTISGVQTGAAIDQCEPTSLLLGCRFRFD